MSELLARPLLLLLKLYSLVLSPYMPGQCRYSPTCSQYAAQAIAARGPLIGSWLTMRRLTRCILWRGAGIDPVPLAAAEERS